MPRRSSTYSGSNSFCRIDGIRSVPAGKHANIARMLRKTRQRPLRRRAAEATGIAEGSIRTSGRGWRFAARRIERMPLRPFALEAKRSTMFAKTCGRRWIYALGQVQSLVLSLRPQRSQHALRRERRFMQAHADCIVDRIRNCRNGRRQRSFAAFLRAKRTFRIDALHNDRLDFGRLHRRWTAVFQQPAFISIPSFHTISSVSACPMPIHTEPIICPSTETGFSARPQSCAAQTLCTVTSPVSSSTLTSATCAEYE